MMSVDFNKSLTTRFLLLSCKYRRNIKKNNGAVVVVIVWLFDLQLPVQSVPITTKVESSNPVHGELYSMQNYVIKLVTSIVICSKMGINHIITKDHTDNSVNV